MASGGAYVIKDSTESVEFPAPVTAWQEQPLGGGLNGVPNFNAYRLHIWRLVGLPEELQAKLAAIQTRQQTGNARPTSIETDPYDAIDDCDQSYRTVVYTDATIINVARERGYGHYQNVTVTFEVLVS